MAKVLSQRAAEAARPKAKRYGKSDGIIPGQQLLVHPTGKKVYRLLARVNGKQENFAIGDATIVTLAEARAKGKAILAAIAKGEDPRATREAAVRAASETVEVVAKDFIERHAKVHNKRRTWQETERLIAGNILPRWGKRPITSITPRDVVQLLDTIVDRGAATAANRVYTAGKTLFGWAITRHLIETSPFERVKAPTRETTRDHVLSDFELALVLRATEALAYPLRPYFLLLALTGQRREEIAGMRWCELDADLTMWTLPPARVKNGIQHQVAIVPRVRSILATLPRFAGSDYVFTTTAGTSLSSFSRARLALDAAIADLNDDEPIAPWRVHDLRRTMATRMAKLGVQLPVVEKLLNHVSGTFGGVQGIYQRHDFADEKRVALECWTQHLLTLLEGGDRPVAAAKPAQSRVLA